MTDCEKHQYRKLHKEYTDRLRFERMRRDPSDSVSLLPRDDFTGDSTPTLRPESKVLTDRLEVGHSFALKSTLIMRVAEEANLCGIDFNIVRSDILSFKVHRYSIWGRGVPFRAKWVEGEGVRNKRG